MNEKKVKKAVDAVAKAEWKVSKAMNKLAKVSLTPKNSKSLANAAERARMFAGALEDALNKLVDECSKPD